MYTWLIQILLSPQWNEMKKRAAIIWFESIFIFFSELFKKEKFFCDYLRLDSILIVEREKQFVYKSFTTNNIFAFDFSGEMIAFNKIETHDLNTRNLYYNYRTYLRDRNFSSLEENYLFHQFSAKFQLKKIFLIWIKK